MSREFQFYTEYHLPVLLGLKARNINELMQYLKEVPEASIYYHTHRFLKVHHYLVPEPPNDFSYWIRNTLNLRELGELISSVNTVAFKSLEELRNKFVVLLENFRDKDSDVYSVNCSRGDEFQFMPCTTFCFPLEKTARTLAEFVDILKNASVNSLHYHIYEPKLRRGNKENDFAEWFREIGEDELAEKVSMLDPYASTMVGLKEDIINLVKKYGNHN